MKTNSATPSNSKILSELIDARLGNGVALSSTLMSLEPPLDPNNLDQITAFATRRV
jgi:hypothetical protein